MGSKQRGRGNLKTNGRPDYVEKGIRINTVF